MRHATRFLVVAALYAACPGGFAAEAGRASAPSVAAPTRQLVEQKQAFVNRLLGDSPAITRIARSGNAQAQQFLSGAREQNAKAVAVLQSGDIGAADAAFNDAIWMIGKALQLVPDPRSRAVEQRVRYAQLLASIESLQGSYRTHLSHLRRAEKEDGAWTTVSRLVEQAKALAATEQVGEANRTLLQAEHDLLAAFGKVLSATTIDYTLHFSDAADEYRFEFDRNRSYSDLVPLAVAELKPSQDATKLIGRYVESNLAMRSMAQQQAAGKNYPEALKNLRAGTAYLQRALLAAGLVVPQELKDD